MCKVQNTHMKLILSELAHKMKVGDQVKSVVYLNEFYRLDGINLPANMAVHYYNKFKDSTFVPFDIREKLYNDASRVVLA